MKRFLVSATLTGTVIGLSLSAASAADRRGPAPVVESIPVESFQSSSPDPQFQRWKKQVDARLARMERINSNRALMSLVQQIDQLTNELSQLRGQIEELDYQLNKLSDRQKKIYQSQDQHLTDLDRRITALEKRPVVVAPTVPASSPSPATLAPTVPNTAQTPAPSLTAPKPSATLKTSPAPKVAIPSATAPINQERNSTPEEKMSYQAAFKLVY
ncbi:MAG: hypothetical protein D6698_11805, partial [Gammaproteobacteria bacterium]